MSEYTVSCPSCGTELAIDESLIGQSCRCPQCNELLNLKFDEPAAPPASVAPAPGAARLPQRMKANKLLVGQACSQCRQAFGLGDDVFNCQLCGQPMHAHCHDEIKGCANHSCADFPQPATKTSLKTPSAPPDSGDEKACRFCGETIKSSARKCRFCNEYQQESDRVKQHMRQKELKAGSNEDSLAASEVAFGIFCGLIALITSIVWIIQGKRKGWKLLLVNIVSIIIWSTIRLLAES